MLSASFPPDFDQRTALCHPDALSLGSENVRYQFHYQLMFRTGRGTAREIREDIDRRSSADARRGFMREGEMRGQIFRINGLFLRDLFAIHFCDERSNIFGGRSVIDQRHAPHLRRTLAVFLQLVRKHLHAARSGRDALIQSGSVRRAGEGPEISGVEDDADEILEVHG